MWTIPIVFYFKDTRIVVIADQYWDWRCGNEDNITVRVWVRYLRVVKGYIIQWSKMLQQSQ